MAREMLVLTYFSMILATSAGLDCFVCNSLSSNEECNQNTRNCDQNQESCMNEIRVHSGSKRISKMCKQTQACEGQAQENSNTCNGGTENSVCYYCCQGDLCNRAEDAREPSTTAAQTTTANVLSTSASTTIALPNSSTVSSTASVSTKEPTTNETEHEAQECYQCNSASSNEDCNTNTAVCGNNQGSCSNEIRFNNGRKQITKSCKQTQACESQTGQNQNNCNMDANNYVCYFCCTGNLCNVLEDPTEGSTGVTTESTSLSTTTTTTTSTTTSTTPAASSTSTTTTTTAASTSASTSPSTTQKCPSLPAPRYGQISCTDGDNERSRCDVICDENYALSQGLPASRRCVCFNGVCNWNGLAAVCEYEADAPITCDIPNFSRASYSVEDIWPTAAILKVNIKPTSQTTNGWSFAIMFARPLPEGFEVESGHVSLVTTSEDRRILTFNSMESNKDVSDFQTRNIFLYLKNMEENTSAARYLAMVGFYDKIVRDGSCIDYVSPLRPLPTTTTASTTTASTISVSTRSPTTTTSRPTTTTQSTTTTTTTPRTTTTTTTTTPPLVVGDCEVLDDSYEVSSNGWSESGNWKFNSAVKKNINEGDEVKDWIYKVEFSEPVDSIEVYVASASQTENPKIWLFMALNWNEVLYRDQRISFIGTLTGGSAAPSATVTFCKDGAIPDVNPSGGVSSTTSTTLPTSLPPSQSPGSESSTTSSAVSPAFAANCALTTRNSFGNLPRTSVQTNPSTFNPSSYFSSETPTPDGLTTFDYNEVLHKSILFYEAQRSGRLPSNNRIGWRGNAGLKDGCDIGVDLTGGFYDAGDNVKFGFPMAYTMTVLGWGMIEFKDAYEDSGDWQAALDILKWGTDYFIKAHPSKYEFYAQVGDASTDHGKWLRPEDIDYVQVSYKLDKNNPGSDVIAETAAALAAASIVFRSEGSVAYANTAVSHSEELYDFATTYRGEYHDSIPGVENYYKSWSGYKDELLWALIWLHRATDKEQYLNLVENEYDNYGAGVAPPEFSWDNKYAGVQVLMAQTTGEEKYVEDVRNFFFATLNIPTTPLGLTWKLQWGSNRYAANYAFIAVMAAKVANIENEESADFVQYAESQINYMLGRNEKLRSYVVGFGEDPPERPHHRASSCPRWSRTSSVPTCGFNALNNPQANPHTLYGALVGGPDVNGDYTDDRTDYISNEVATDYNAGFQSAVAGLQYFAIAGRI